MNQGKMNIGFTHRNVAILGRNLYVGAPQLYSTIDTEDIVEYASKAAGVTKACMLATFAALYDAFEYYLCNGHSFKLDGVGTFSLSLSAATADPTASGTVSGSDAVQSVGVNFLPCVEIKNLIQSISWNSVVNATSLVEFTDFVPRKVFLGSDSVNILTPDSSEAHILAAGSTISVEGWNCPSTATLTVEGEDASGASVSETFALSLNAKKSCLSMVASAKATKAIAKVTKITLNGTEYDYTGVATYTVKAGSNLVINGASFVAGTYNTTFVGKNIGSQTVKLDGDVVAFSSSSTNSCVATLELAAGEHTLQIGESDTRTFTCTAEAVPNVISLTSNGVTVENGGSSAMKSGNTYAMVANGQNLNKLSSSDITAPDGSVVSDFTVSSDGTKLEFNLIYDGTAGAIKIGSYFTVNITTAVAAIVTVDNTATGGTVEGDTFQIAGTTSGKFKLTIKSTGADVSSYATWNEGSSTLTLNGSAAVGTYSLVIYDTDGTTSLWTGTLEYTAGEVGN